MIAPRWFRHIVGAFFVFASTVAAAQDSDNDSRAIEAERQAARTAIVASVDRRLAERLTAAKLTPAAPASDSEFARRVWLDLTGVTPRVSDVREFLADTRLDKRGRLVDRLLVSPAHANHLANRWRDVLLPGGTEFERADQSIGVQNWLRTQFSDNIRYDRLVSEFLVAREGSEAGPALFYTSLELKPEKLAGATARIFLGLQIECAQCHHHPFDHWKQEQFWGYAAFFAQLRQPRGEGPVNVRLEDLNEGEVKLPNSETVIPPRFPGTTENSPDSIGTRREQLAIWMASRDNPYLARAAVNRVWAHLFGRGLVEPVDDLSPQHPASHPELFSELTTWFVRSGFDQRELYRVLTATQAYHRTSSWSEDEEPPPELYAHMLDKPLTAEQLYDSLLRLVARTNSRGGGPAGAINALRDPRRLAFIAKMQTASKSATDYQAGVLQALTLMNGDETATVTNPEQGSLLASLTAPFFSVEDRVEILFLATLSRIPTDEERTAFLAHVRDKPQDRSTWSDLLWAIVNSAEFTMNH